jgi:hypothetical protein
MTRHFSTVLFLLAVLTLSFGCKKPDDNGGGDMTTIQYQTSLEIFPNPERGFMHLLIAQSEGQPLNPYTLASLREEGVSIIQRLYYLENFKDKPMSDLELDLICNDMQLLRDAGLKCVLRFAYTDDMAGTDAPLDIVKQHLDQLKPVFEQNEDVIAFVQAGFIGAWGEWHSSSNGLATVANEKEVINKLLSVLPAGIMVQVRTPREKQDIVGSTLPLDATLAYTSDIKARIGHHNDCFLAGGTDYGTYTNVSVDKDYISKEALYVPTGGETCPPEDVFPDCSTAKTEMALLKWTYLNLDWYQPVLDAWRNSGCFEDFERYMGYRLVLQTAKFPKSVKTGSDLTLEIKLTNKGYAPVYNEKKSSLVLVNTTTNDQYKIDLQADIRKCKPNGVQTISESLSLSGIPAGTYHLYLKTADKNDDLAGRSEYCIRFANMNLWNEETGLNDLLHQLEVTSN